MDPELAQHLTSACPLIRKLVKKIPHTSGIKHLCLENYSNRILYLFEYKGYEFETWYFDPHVYKTDYLYEFRLRKKGQAVSVRAVKSSTDRPIYAAVFSALNFVKGETGA